MGQISSPLSMRYSKSMHWPVLGVDTLNLTKKLKTDVFSNMILSLLFNETIYLNKYTNNAFILFYLNTMKLNNISVKKFFENNFFLKKIYFNTLTTLTPFFLSFFGKVWIIKFNSWLIIVLYVYSPKQVVSIKKLKNSSFTKTSYLIWKEKLCINSKKLKNLSNFNFLY